MPNLIQNHILKPTDAGEVMHHKATGRGSSDGYEMMAGQVALPSGETGLGNNGTDGVGTIFGRGEGKELLGRRVLDGGGGKGDEGAADGLTLVGVAGGEDFGDGSFFGGVSVVEELVVAGVEGVAGLVGDGDEADFAGGVAAGVLELADLGDEVGLAGVLGGDMEGVDVVEDADEGLKGFAFGAAEFFDFEAEAVFFGVVGFLEEVGEGPGFGGE